MGGAAVACAIAASLAHAQGTTCNPGDTEVRAVNFVGNKTFDDAELENAIVTTPSSFVRRLLGIFGTRRCLDRNEFPSDRFRLIILYHNHGFPRATVDTAVKLVDPHLADVTFTIQEGTPTRIDTLMLLGLSKLDPDVRRQVTNRLPARLDGRLDKYAIDATVDTLRLRLLNAGYPYADVSRHYAADSAKRFATVVFTVVTGPRARVGQIHIAVTPRTLDGKQKISDDVVRRIMRLQPGELFSVNGMAQAQRHLYQTQDYLHVAIRAIPDSALLAAANRGDTSINAGPDTTINLETQLAEAYMHSARIGAGWGTLDCFRTQAEYTNRNFLSDALEMRLNATVTKIGIGAPFNFAPALCPQARTDLYSDTLNYGVSAGLHSAFLFGLPLSPTFTVFSARQSEFNAYVRSTPIGATATVTHQLSRMLTLTPGYRLEYGSTTAQPAFFCVVFSLCSAQDQNVAGERRRLAVANLTLTFDNRGGDFENPDRGVLASLDLRHASTFVGSSPDEQFNKAVGDVALYEQAGGGGVLAARLRVGVVVGTSLNGFNTFIPPEERLYAGGSTTVRGFAQNELGPVAYLPNTVTENAPNRGPGFGYSTNPAGGEHVIPEGGNSSVVANIEYRVRSPFLPRLLQWTFFYDGGQVWNDTTGVRFVLKELQWTPGIGLRAFSPIGPVRIDVGYNPYPRPAGPAYYNPPVVNGETAQLYCVSPGTPAGEQLQSNTSPRCQAQYTPRSPVSFFQRLTLNLSIGQAF